VEGELREREEEKRERESNASAYAYFFLILCLNHVLISMRGTFNGKGEKSVSARLHSPLLFYRDDQRLEGADPCGK